MKEEYKLVLENIKSNDKELIAKGLKKFKLLEEAELFNSGIGAKKSNESYSKQLISIGVPSRLNELLSTYVPTLENDREPFNSIETDIVLYSVVLLSTLTSEYGSSKQFISMGFVPLLLKIIRSKTLLELQTVTILVLSNIANDTLNSREYILEKTDTIATLVELINKTIENQDVNNNMDEFNGITCNQILDSTINFCRVLINNEIVLPSLNSIEILFPVFKKFVLLVPINYGLTTLKLLLFLILKLSDEYTFEMFEVMLSVEFMEKIVEFTYHNDKDIQFFASKIMLNTSAIIDQLPDLATVYKCFKTSYITRLNSLLSSDSSKNKLNQILNMTIVNTCEMGEQYSKDLINAGILKKLNSIYIQNLIVNDVGKRLVLTNLRGVPAEEIPEIDGASKHWNKRRVISRIQREFIYSICMLIKFLRDDQMMTDIVFNGESVRNIANFINDFNDHLKNYPTLEISINESNEDYEAIREVEETYDLVIETFEHMYAVITKYETDNPKKELLEPTLNLFKENYYPQLLYRFLQTEDTYHKNDAIIQKTIWILRNIFNELK